MNEENLELIYNEISEDISTFLIDNNNFDLSDEDIKEEIINIIRYSNIDYKQSKNKLLNFIKKELKNKYETYEEDIGVKESIRAYLIEIGKYKVLTKEEEQKLFNKYKNGDLESKKKIINSNLKLVVSIAKTFPFRDDQLLDLIQDGNLGLMKAVEMFDPSLGYKFSTYATYWIKQHIIRSLQNKEKTIRIPIHVTATQNKIKKLENKYIVENGKKLTNEEIADLLKIPLKEVIDAKEAEYKYTSTNIKINEEEDVELGETIPTDEVLEDSIIANALPDEMKNFFKKASLTDEQISVIMYRFGLVDGINHTLEQTGKTLKINKERVRLIEVKALMKLKRCPYKEIIKNYYIEDYDIKDDKGKMKYKKLY